MPIIGYFVITAPISVPFLIMLFMGLRKKKKDKKGGLKLIILSVVYLIIGSGVCYTLVYGLRHAIPGREKFVAIIKFQDGKKSFEYGHRGIIYEINAIEGNDTILVASFECTDSCSFSIFNQNLILFTNNKMNKDRVLCFIDRKDPNKDFVTFRPSYYSDTTNSILVTAYKTSLDVEDSLLDDASRWRTVEFNVIQFTDLTNFISSNLNVEAKDWPGFPDNYTLRIEKNNLVVNHIEQTWKYDIQHQLDELKN